MPGYPVRILLAATSLAPALFTYAALIFLGNPKLGIFWIVLALALAVTCRIVLNVYRRKLEIYPSFRIKAVKPADQAVFAYIVAYLLPLLLENYTDVNLLGIAAIFGVLFLAIYRSNAYSFNPLLVMLFRYHFYEVTTEDPEFTYVLVSKREIKNTEAPVESVQISHYMFLDLRE